jgi:IS4 transposase
MDVYQKRWPIEEYHKSIKSNTGLAKSPTKTIRTQQNHFFASIYAYFKLEVLKIQTKLNHFAIKSKLYIQVLQASMRQLEKLQLST